VVVSLAVAPSPVFLLFSNRQLVKVSMFITVVFAGPPLIITHFGVVPDVDPNAIP